MIISEIKKEDAVQENSYKEFPFIGISNKGNDLIVLFNEDRKGVVLVQGSSINKVGHYSECWSMSSFDRFKESVILKNKEKRQ